MKTFTTFLLAILSFVILTSTCMADRTIDDIIKDPKLSSQVRQQIIDLLDKENNTIIPDIKNVTQWQEFGNVFATTVKQVCHTLNVEVNQFIKSDVGKLTAGLIIYKIVGKDALRIFIYITSMFMMTLYYGLIVKFIFMKKKIKNKETKEITYIERFEWIDDDIKNLCFVILSIAWFVYICIHVYNMVMV